MFHLPLLFTPKMFHFALVVSLLSTDPRRHWFRLSLFLCFQPTHEDTGFALESCGGLPLAVCCSKRRALGGVVVVPLLLHVQPNLQLRH